MESLHNHLNRMTGAIMALKAERQMLRNIRPLPPVLLGLMSELQSLEERWLEKLDLAKQEIGTLEVFEAA